MSKKLKRFAWWTCPVHGSDRVKRGVRPCCALARRDNPNKLKARRLDLR